MRSIGLGSGVRRNPQTFIPNIFFGKRTEYKMGVVRVCHSPGQGRLVELLVVEAGC